MHDGVNGTQILLIPECFYLASRQPKDTVVALKLAPKFLHTHCHEVEFIPLPLNMAGLGPRGRPTE